MDTAAYLKLQNGSDVRGVALPGVADEPVDLTPESSRTLDTLLQIASPKRKGPNLPS